MIKAFNKVYPNVKVTYHPVGDNLPTVVSTAVAGGNPPDMADIAQPGLVAQFVAKGALKPITYSRKVLIANFSPSWIALGTFNHKIYGLVFKASNKSTVWYNVPAFKNAGVKAPTTWTQFITNARHDQGIRHSALLDRRRRRMDAHRPVREHLPPPGRGGEVRALTAHKIKWTDPTVTAALKTMAQVIGTRRTWPAARRARCRPTSRPR